MTPLKALMLFSSVMLLSLGALSSRADMITAVTPPAGFDEGTETQLSPPQIQEILPWAKNSEITLKDLLESARTATTADAKVILTRGIREIVLASAPKQTEILMRYVLNRALKITTEIDQEANLDQPGVLDQQVRVLKLSVALALEYFKSDVEFLNGQFHPRESRDSAISPPFAEFGIRYVQFLMSVDHSLFDASAQYSLAIMAMGLFQWDLYRDQNRAIYSPAIGKIQTTLQTLPERISQSDENAVKNLRLLKTAFKRAFDLAKKAFDDVNRTREEKDQEFRAKREAERQKAESAKRVAEGKAKDEQEALAQMAQQQKLEQAKNERVHALKALGFSAAIASCGHFSKSETKAKCYSDVVTAFQDQGNTHLRWVKKGCEVSKSWAAEVSCFVSGFNGISDKKPLLDLFKNMCIAGNHPESIERCLSVYYILPPELIGFDYGVDILYACSQRKKLAEQTNCLWKGLESSASISYLASAKNSCLEGGGTHESLFLCIKGAAEKYSQRSFYDAIVQNCSGSDSWSKDYNCSLEYLNHYLAREGKGQ